MVDVRKILKGEIERRGFNQAAIARKAGMTSQQLCDVFNMRRKLEANEMLAVCDAMELNPMEVVRARHETNSPHSA